MIVRHPFRLLALPVVLLVAALAVLAGCGDEDQASGAAAASGGDSTLTLVGYTTPREVYEELIPLFGGTPAGKGIGFEQSYGPSGDQSRAVEAGLDADVLALSLAPDVTRLEEPGIVEPGWQDTPTGGFVSTSAVVFLVREGNPKGIRTWDDLVKDGVEVITPNPFSSGGAQWNVAAAYGAQLKQGRSKDEALEYLRALFANVPVQPKGARESLQVFGAGKGDVLLAYENEAKLAQANGEPVEYVIPDETILIQNPIAVTANSGDPQAAQAFVDFALSAPAQEVFARRGYRSVLPAVAEKHASEYPEIPGLFTMDEDLGGWTSFRDEFFDPDRGYMADIFADRGFSQDDE
ncbi:sulfate ABC transporter substrate-binding protein [Miltoncostaea marina]|uniref:sulfate ABC transporter substrate-binding protein n=1 Tax=Miltoncostaea marina TaxID=2843215 RepID=UPI001C3D955E|nr:sulfate ABC transporter substrate-binding protein [Miltoncostaea marina]